MLISFTVMRVLGFAMILALGILRTIKFEDDNPPSQYTLGIYVMVSLSLLQISI